MKPIQTQVRKEGNTILYFLYGHRVDFSESEFEALILGIREGGLFQYLQQERPGLISTLIGILKSQYDPETWEEMEPISEHILEQSILDVKEALGY